MWMLWLLEPFYPIINESELKMCKYTSLKKIFCVDFFSVKQWFSNLHYEENVPEVRNGFIFYVKNVVNTVSNSICVLKLLPTGRC